MLAALQQRPRPLPLFLALLREQTHGQPERAARALEGLRRYQQAERRPVAAVMPAIAEIQGAALRDYGGTGAPIVFVPSLINPPNVLDLPGRSLLRWLADQGPRVLLLDWGWPDEARRELSVTGHVEQILLPLLDRLDRPPALAGYCLGGTMALAAAQLAPVRSLATIAAPWHFTGFPEEARARLARLWKASRPTVDAMGLLPMEVLQSAFWNLDPARTVSKFEAFAGLEGEAAERFVTLEDWANDGPPLAGAAARQLFEEMFARDVTGEGAWQVGGAPVRLDEMTVPMLHIVSATDRIVPAASAPDRGESLTLQQGHVGMVAGSAAHERLWQPLAAWLSRTAAK
jgi:polyhydroxyalkanoate synthase